MTETVVACLTPPGTGAIATIGVYGPDAWVLCRALFTPRGAPLPEVPDTIPVGRFFLGLCGDELHDESILAIRRLVPVPSIEIHCHGGREVVAMLLEAFQRRGARVLSWQEWLQRTADSSIRAEAAVALAHALTTRTAGILLDQYQGAFESVLESVRGAIEGEDLQGAETMLTGLLRYAGVGRHLTHPFRVVVAGAPNVGKSSLVNALAGFQRSIVSEAPGTTRDVVTTLIAVDGWPIELADTAGLRESGESLEVQGIQLARDTTAAADLCIWLVDVSMPPLWPGAFSVPVLRLVNKIDLQAVWDVEAVQGAVRLSARTGEGLPELCTTLASMLVPEPPAPGAPVPFTEQWCQRLESARRACADGNVQRAREALVE
jgi:tRNA modification GTPase